MSTAHNRGFSVIEIAVASAILLTLVGSAAGAFSLYLRLSHGNTDRTQAALLTEEASEAIQFLRDQSWNKNIASLPTNTDIYLSWDGTKHSTSTTPLDNGGYAVSFKLFPVNRDSNSNIVSSGGTPDGRTRLVTIGISRFSSTTDIILSTNMLIHDLFQN